MFGKPEEVRMTREEMEEYGRKINARNAEYEHVEVGGGKYRWLLIRFLRR